MSDFTPQQGAAISARGNLLVVAGAGTGKTHTLVARCLRFVIEERASLENILMVTFTEAAAAEMRARIREELHTLQATNAGDEHLAQQLALLDTARICTLHGFCLQLAREHFHELGLDPQFSVLDEQQTRPLMREVLDELFEQSYSSGDDNARAIQTLVREVGRGADGRIRTLVLKLHAYSQALPDPARWLDEQQARFEQTQPDEWRRWFLDAVNAWRSESLDLVATSANAAPAVKLCLAALQELPALPDFAAAARILRGMQAADVDANWPLGTRGTVRKPLRDIFGGAEFLAALLPDEQGNDPLAQDWAWARQHMAALVSLTRDFTARFAAAKREMAGVDFADLEQCALRLLRESSIAKEWRARLTQVLVDEYQDINAAQDAIINALSGDRNRFMVGDVKQSIYRFRLANPKIFQSYKVAWNLPPLSRPSATLFATGGENSPKAPRIEPPNPGAPPLPSLSPAPSGGEGGLWPGEGEVRGEGGMRGQRARGGHGESGTTISGRVVSLTENFRSHEALLKFVNLLFAALMREEIGGVAYEPLEFGTPAERAALQARPADPPCVELHLVARADDENGPDDTEAENDSAIVVPDLLAVEREARLVARRLRELKASGHEVWDKEQKCFRPAKWSDMAVLLRSPAGRAEAFAMEFSKAGVPLTAARDGFFASLEVSDLVNLLRLLDNPLQDVPLAAVLRSPLVGLSFDELAQVRAHNDARPFWTALARFHEVQSSEAKVQSPRSEAKNRELVGHALREKVSQFLDQYGRWRELVRQTSLSQCLEGALTETHYEALLLAGARGDERAANVRRLLDLARQFDPYQRQGLYRFLKFVEAQEEAELDSQPELSPTEDAVRLISIHKSKGLEFPVVALACLGTRFNERDLNEPVLLSECHGLCPKITPPDSQQSFPSLPFWLARRGERRELRGEELRLLYVAMTRARDTLILAGTTGRKAGIVRWQAPPSGSVSTSEVVFARSHLDWLLMWLPRAVAEKDWRNDRDGENEFLRWRIYQENDAAFADEVPKEREAATDSRNAGTNDTELVEDVKARLAWQYPFVAATTEAAKTSVSAIRRRVANEEEGEVRDIFATHPGRAAMRSRTTGETTRLSAAERGNAHHLFLQLLNLERAGSEAELKAEAQRFSQEGRMKPEQIAALDFASIASFWRSDLGRRIRSHAGCVRRELAFTARFSTRELEALTSESKLLHSHRSPEPLGIPLTRPADTRSPDGGENSPKAPCIEPLNPGAPPLPSLSPAPSGGEGGLRPGEGEVREEGWGEGARAGERKCTADLSEDFVVVQGVADLVALLPKEIWLVDFKTDEMDASEVEAKKKLYEPQLKSYALALARIYRRPVTESWLHFLAIAKTVQVATTATIQTASHTEKYEQGQLF
jgi:ATP-dependent helicase/nuclease subunit A